MLKWALTFFIVAIVAAILGFSSLAGNLAYLAKIICIVGLVLAVAGFIFGRKK